MSRCVLAREVWKLKVEKGPSEHGVYKLGYLWLAPTFMNEFWKVDPDKSVVVGRFRMPGVVWGAPWVDRMLYMVPLEGDSSENSAWMVGRSGSLTPDWRPSG